MANMHDSAEYGIMCAVRAPEASGTKEQQENEERKENDGGSKEREA